MSELPVRFYRYPLIVSDMLWGIDREFDPKEVCASFLVFERIPGGWRCMSCAETSAIDRVWSGLTEDDVKKHCEAHQMGFDYALYFLKKAGRLK